jgi:hypothetical protein
MKSQPMSPACVALVRALSDLGYELAAETETTS